ncbi:hypothetical protein BAJUN_00050 [Bajunvirus bajun]|uniref:Uncharacterized protein n=1 Tax=Brevundimonas phage vB_BgoS-Bajun TaxID=2948594 RepID=A0A9E7N617_9CAUD|nr:hypothetical protein BAJUN_00050 [Brevundimonas phage vB_BgoS-Bajun]
MTVDVVYLDEDEAESLFLGSGMKEFIFEGWHRRTGPGPYDLKGPYDTKEEAETMTLFEQIGAQALEERKARSPVAGKLITLKAECEAVGKREQRDPTDDECVKVINRFKAGVEETVKVQTERGADPDLITLLNSEVALYAAFLPDMLDEAALVEAVKAAAAEAGVPIEQRQTGVIKTALQAKYPGRVDGKVLAGVIKSLSA